MRIAQYEGASANGYTHAAPRGVEGAGLLGSALQGGPGGVVDGQQADGVNQDGAAGLGVLSGVVPPGDRDLYGRQPQVV